MWKGEKKKTKMRKKQKQKRKMGRGGKQLELSSSARLWFSAEGRRVKTMGVEVYISGKPNRVSYARMRSYGPFKYHWSLDRARFIFPPPPRLQKSFTICSVASASTDQIWFVSPPWNGGSDWKYFFFFGIKDGVHIVRRFIVFFFLWSFDMDEKKKGKSEQVYKWS